MPELTCAFCGRPAKSATEHADPERDLGHRAGVVREPNAEDDFAHHRITHGARIAFAGLRYGRIRSGGSGR